MMCCRINKREHDMINLDTRAWEELVVLRGIRLRVVTRLVRAEPLIMVDRHFHLILEGLGDRCLMIF